MKRYLILFMTTLGIVIPTFNVQAAEQGWFLRPNLGVSTLSDQTVASSLVLGTTGPAELSTDNGFVAGLGVGYRYNEKIGVELAWEYRTNDSDVVLANGSTVDEGDFASNTFFLNGFYHFNSIRAWQPYIGAGLSWVQEVDIDLETPTGEQSYSANGDVGLQLFAGVIYELSDHWQLQTELRYGHVANINLTSEGSTQGQFDDVDYTATTLQLGVVYQF